MILKIHINLKSFGLNTQFREAGSYLIESVRSLKLKDYNMEQVEIDYHESLNDIFDIDYIKENFPYWLENNPLMTGGNAVRENDPIMYNVGLNEFRLKDEYNIIKGQEYIDKFNIIGFKYEADIHCPDCALIAYPALDENTVDSEGNRVHPLTNLDSFEQDEYCGTCGSEIYYSEYEQTYWNAEGKYQKLEDDLEDLIPYSGEIENKPALENLRKALNLYYDLYNNALMNYRRKFELFFNVSVPDSFLGGERKFKDKEIIKSIEGSMDGFVILAAKEQGLNVPEV